MKLFRRKKSLFIIFNLFILLFNACSSSNEITEPTASNNTFGIVITSNMPIRQQEYNNMMKKENMIATYPVATTVYYKLSRDLGLSDICCAGILGNMMAECGGSTLDLQWDIWDETHSYYGLCQWSIIYNPKIIDNDLSEQLNYLEWSLSEELDIFGFNYQEDFGYIAFTQLEDCGEVALAFAKCYERCHPDYYELRVENAEVALNFIQTIK